MKWLALAVALGGCSDSPSCAGAACVVQPKPDLSSGADLAGLTSSDLAGSSDMAVAAGDVTCLSMNRDACRMCCGSHHPSIYSQFRGVLSDCMCNDQCAAQCGNSKVCNPTYPFDTQECLDCRNAASADHSGTCYQEAVRHCYTDSGCDAFLNCTDACPN